MPATRPCIVGRMGSTTYYVTTMTCRELQAQVRPSADSDTWASGSIEERLQRTFDVKRIRETIASYLAHDTDHLFGSLLVLAPPGAIEFEPISDVVTHDVPKAYRDAAGRLGFLTVGDRDLIALDGQHRLLAIREVLSVGAADGSASVADDEVCVMFIEHEDSTKTRRIFSRVNRHARPTARSDSLLTREDDPSAIVTRWLLDVDRAGPLAERRVEGERIELVNWTSNTLGQNSRHLTTLSTVYETVKDILGSRAVDAGCVSHGSDALAEASLLAAFEVTADWWSAILDMDAFANVLTNLSAVPNIRRDPSHRHNLLLRPQGQVALVRGVIRAIELTSGRVQLADAMRRANSIDFSIHLASTWRTTLVRGDGRVSTRREDVALAADRIAALITDPTGPRPSDSTSPGRGGGSDGPN
jgi:DNA sulfur modification protein DndB